MNLSIDLSSIYSDSGVKEVLDQLDHDLIGLLPVKTRIKEIAALLVEKILGKSLSKNDIELLINKNSSVKDA